MKDLGTRFTRPGAFIAAMLASGVQLSCANSDPFDRSTESVMTTGLVRYRIVDVRALYAGDIAVNDSGTVVGSNRPVDNSTARKVFAFNGGIQTPLGFGQGDEHVYAINNKGWAVGSGENGLTIYRDGKVESFPELLGPQSVGRDINSHGDVAGAAVDAGSKTLQAILVGTGGVTRLGTLGGPGANALALNEQGQVAGVADTGDTWGDRPVPNAFL